MALIIVQKQSKDKRQGMTIHYLVDRETLDNAWYNVPLSEKSSRSLSMSFFAMLENVARAQTTDKSDPHVPRPAGLGPILPPNRVKAFIDDQLSIPDEYWKECTSREEAEKVWKDETIQTRPKKHGLWKLCSGFQSSSIHAKMPCWFDDRHFPSTRNVPYCWFLDETKESITDVITIC